MQVTARLKLKMKAVSKTVQKHDEDISFLQMGAKHTEREVQKNKNASNKRHDDAEKRLGEMQQTLTMFHNDFDERMGKFEEEQKVAANDRRRLSAGLKNQVAQAELHAGRLDAGEEETKQLKMAHEQVSRQSGLHLPPPTLLLACCCCCCFCCYCCCSRLVLPCHLLCSLAAPCPPFNSC